MAKKIQEKEPQAGDLAADGSVYVGTSPSTGKPLYAAAEDESSRMSWWRAKHAAGHKEAHGHDDWRLPTPAELSLLLKNRQTGALSNTFNTFGSAQEAFYWSAARKGLRYAKAECSYSGVVKGSVGIKKRGHLSVRCVRNG